MAMAVDRGLRDRVESNGKRWVIDANVESLHIRDSLWRTLKHDYRLLCGIQREDQLVDIGSLRTLLYSPMFALFTVMHTREPMLFPYVICHKIVKTAVTLHRYNAINEAKKCSIND